MGLACAHCQLSIQRSCNTHDNTTALHCMCSTSMLFVCGYTTASLWNIAKPHVTFRETWRKQECSRLCSIMHEGTSCFKFCCQCSCIVYRHPLRDGCPASYGDNTAAGHNSSQPISVRKDCACPLRYAKGEGCNLQQSPSMQEVSLSISCEAGGSLTSVSSWKTATSPVTDSQPS